MVQCEDCEDWFHRECVEERVAPAELDDEKMDALFAGEEPFVCRDCTPEGGATAPRQWRPADPAAQAEAEAALAAWFVDEMALAMKQKDRGQVHATIQGFLEVAALSVARKRGSQDEVTDADVATAKILVDPLIARARTLRV